MAKADSESIDNIGFVCPAHASKPGKYAKELPETFIGKFVKLSFKGTRPDTGKETDEHMWVKVSRVKRGQLIGVLNNDPVLEMKLRSGDTVKFKVAEIEDVFVDA